MNDLLKQNQNFLLILDVLSLNIKYSAKQCPKTEWQSKHSRTKVTQIWIIFKKMIHIFFGQRQLIYTFLYSAMSKI